MNNYKQLLSQYETMDSKRETENMIDDFIENTLSGGKDNVWSQTINEAFDFLEKVLT